MRTFLTTALIGVVLSACTRGPGVADDTTAMDSAGATAAPASTGTATATLRDASGRELGTLTLTDTVGGIVVSGRLSGLAPGEHGLHLHMTGSCEPPAFASAGPHWNPTSAQHGAQNPQGPHRGDMPNVSAGPDSSAVVQALTPGGSLRGAADMLLDADAAAVILHASGDDYRTDPSGGSGSPIACGVVTDTGR
ncbi:Superoxide dismutase [Cu-Zn] [Planctomycetaceae bacterium]|nr:Superoxide dismutase [Cu-Zn] [Planctomycetaceae bacterium]